MLALLCSLQLYIFHHISGRMRVVESKLEFAWYMKATALPSIERRAQPAFVRCDPSLTNGLHCILKVSVTW